MWLLIHPFENYTWIAAALCYLREDSLEKVKAAPDSYQVILTDPLSFNIMVEQLVEAEMPRFVCLLPPGYEAVEHPAVFANLHPYERGQQGRFRNQQDIYAVQTALWLDLPGKSASEILDLYLNTVSCDLLFLDGAAARAVENALDLRHKATYLDPRSQVPENTEGKIVFSDFDSLDAMFAANRDMDVTTLPPMIAFGHEEPTREQRFRDRMANNLPPWSALDRLEDIKRDICCILTHVSAKEFQYNLTEAQIYAVSY